MRQVQERIKKISKSLRFLSYRIKEDRKAVRDLEQELDHLIKMQGEETNV